MELYYFTVGGTNDEYILANSKMEALEKYRMKLNSKTTIQLASDVLDDADRENLMKAIIERDRINVNDDEFDYPKFMKNLFDSLVVLFKKKNADYGSSFEEHGQVGVMIRMHDKFKRFLNIAQTEVQLIEDEKMDDTLKDLIVYSSMLLGMRRRDREGGLK